MRFKIEMKVGLPENHTNLIWPREGFTGMIDANEVQKVIAVLPKALPTDNNNGINEIQKLQITLEGIEDEEEQNQVSD